MPPLSSCSPPRGAGGAVPREASPPRQQQPPLPVSSSSSFSAAAFQPPWALEAGRGSLSATELAVVALGRAFFFCYALLRFLLVSLNVLPGPGGGGRSLSSSVARLGGMPPRMEVAREAAERVAARVLVRRDIFFFVFSPDESIGGSLSSSLSLSRAPFTVVVSFFSNLRRSSVPYLVDIGEGTRGKKKQNPTPRRGWFLFERRKNQPRWKRFTDRRRIFSLSLSFFFFSLSLSLSLSPAPPFWRALLG